MKSGMNRLTITLEMDLDVAEGLAALLAEQWNDRGFRELSDELYTRVDREKLSDD